MDNFNPRQLSIKPGIISRQMSPVKDLSSVAIATFFYCAKMASRFQNIGAIKNAAGNFSLLLEIYNLQFMLKNVLTQSLNPIKYI